MKPLISILQRRHRFPGPWIVPDPDRTQSFTSKICTPGNRSRSSIQCHERVASFRFLASTICMWPPQTYHYPSCCNALSIRRPHEVYGSQQPCMEHMDEISPHKKYHLTLQCIQTTRYWRCRITCPFVRPKKSKTISVNDRFVYDRITGYNLDPGNMRDVTDNED